MTKYYLDTEFYEDGKTIDLISLALVCEDGRELWGRSSSAAIRREALVAWFPPASYVEIDSETPGHRRCRYCTGGWWGLSHCCRRGLATEDYGARLIASLEKRTSEKK